MAWYYEMALYGLYGRRLRVQYHVRMLEKLWYTTIATYAGGEVRSWQTLDPFARAPCVQKKCKVDLSISAADVAVNSRSMDFLFPKSMELELRLEYFWRCSSTKHACFPVDFPALCLSPSPNKRRLNLTVFERASTEFGHTRSRPQRR